MVISQGQFHWGNKGHAQNTDFPLVKSHFPVSKRCSGTATNLSQVLLTLGVMLYTAVARFYGLSSIVLTGLGICHIVVALFLSCAQTLNGGNSSSLPLMVEAWCLIFSILSFFKPTHLFSVIGPFVPMIGLRGLCPQFPRRLQYVVISSQLVYSWSRHWSFPSFQY